MIIMGNDLITNLVNENIVLLNIHRLLAMSTIHEQSIAPHGAHFEKLLKNHSNGMPNDIFLFPQTK